MSTTTKLDDHLVNGGYLMVAILVHCHPHPVDRDTLANIFGCRRVTPLIQTVGNSFPIYEDNGVIGIDGDKVKDFEENGKSLLTV